MNWPPGIPTVPGDLDPVTLGTVGLNVMFLAQ